MRMGVVCVRMSVVFVSFSTCQWVGGGPGQLIYRLKLTENGGSLYENEGSIR